MERKFGGGSHIERGGKRVNYGIIYQFVRPDTHNFGKVPSPNYEEFCQDAAKDETICERCEYYEEPHGCPTCCGHEFKEKEEI